MNLGDGASQMAEFSDPGFPYQGAFSLRVNQQGSCWNQYNVRVRTTRPLFQMICCG